MADDPDGLDGLDGVRRFEFDAREGSVSTAVVSAVAAVSGMTATEMVPLGTVANPDAIDALFWVPASRTARGDVHLTLAYHGYEVTIDSYGVIDVHPLDD